MGLLRVQICSAVKAIFKNWFTPAHSAAFIFNETVLWKEANWIEATFFIEVKDSFDGDDDTMPTEFEWNFYKENMLKTASVWNNTHTFW